jgi:hypothetical protein
LGPRLAATLTDARRKPLIPRKAVFGTAFAMFATGHPNAELGT